MRNLYRSRDGRVVHHSACAHVKAGSIRWLWAEKQTRDYVIRVMRQIGSRPCQLCKPMGPDPWEPNPRRKS